MALNTGVLFGFSFAFVIILIILTFLIASLLLFFSQKLLKFKKPNFKLALASIFITSLAYLIFSQIFTFLFLDFKNLSVEEIKKQSSPIYSLISLIVSILVGSFTISKFYKESFLKSLGVLLVAVIGTGIIMIVIVILLALIIGGWLR